MSHAPGNRCCWHPSWSRLAAVCALVFSFLVVAPDAGATTVTRDGRWLVVDGQPRYLVGVDVQELASIPQWRDKLQYMGPGTGIEKVRIWLYPYWDASHRFPWTYSSATGKFDLEQWNPTFWSELKAFVAECDQRGIVVEITYFSPNTLINSEWSGQKGWPVAFNKTFNVNGVFTGNANGAFLPEFFQLGYQEPAGKTRLRTMQEALLDKTVAEVGGYPNVIFEVCNECPLQNRPGKGTAWNDANYVDWHHEWLDRTATTAPQRLVTAHAQQGWGGNTLGVQNYGTRPTVDLLNFHFYTYDPAAISDLLGGRLGSQATQNVHAYDKVISNNEGTFFYDGAGNPIWSSSDGKDLPSQVRFAWGMLLSGGYFNFLWADALHIGTYAAWAPMAMRAQALVTVAESLDFERMSPVDGALNEYDSMITAGPTQGRWQVLSEPGEQYLAYFWDERGQGYLTADPVSMLLPAGTYDYVWYDVRGAGQLGAAWVMGQGAVVSSGAAPASVPAPPATWKGKQGAALTLVRRSLETLTLSPVADAYADESRPFDKLGQEPAVYVRSTVSGLGRYGFFKFSVPPIQGQIVSARLRLHTLGVDVPSAAQYRVDGTAWSESGVDWENWDQNGLLLTQVASFGPLAAGTRHELALQSTAVPGNGTVTLGLVSNSATSFSADFHSRETASPPYLRVGTSTGQLLSFPATADAWLAQDARYSNFGSAGELRVRTGAGGQGRQSILRFQVSGLSGYVTSATLSLVTQDEVVPDLRVFDVRNAAWSESTVTWDNWDRNGLVLAYVQASGLLTANGWHELDFTSAVDPAGGVLTLGLTSSYDLFGLGFYSRESLQAPQLVIDYEP